MATIAVLGTLDTKGREHAFVADSIRGRGHVPLLVDVKVGDGAFMKTVDKPMTRIYATRAGE